MLSILAATSMPVGKAGSQPASVPPGKQSALPAGTEVAASESSSSNNDGAETNFQHAFSSALHDSTAPVRGEKPPQIANDTRATQKTGVDTRSDDAIASQNPVNANQLFATISPLIAGILSPTPAPKSPGESKTPVPTVPLAPKDPSTSKSKTVPQSEPIDPKATQNSVDSPNAALLSAVAGAFTAMPVLQQVTAQLPDSNKAAGTPDPTPVPAATSVRDMPAAPIAEVQKAPAEAIAPATNAPAQAAQSAPDSLSFALLLHPKVAQGPITSTQSVPVIKQAPEARNTAPAKTTPTADQKTESAELDSKTPASIQPVQPVRIVPTAPVAAAEPSQSHSTAQSVAASDAQRSSDSSATAFQAHASQDSSSADPPSRSKTEAASDSNSAALSGFSDIAKPVITDTSTIPNATAMHGKAAEPVSGTPLTAQILNAQNQAPAPAAKEVVVRLQGATGEAISVRLVDQGGQVQVAVRSSDPATASLLRQDLSSLTNNLDRAGWKPEVLPPVPAAASFVRETSQGSAHDGQNSQGQGQGTLDWNQQDSSRRRSTIADLWDEILTRQGT